MLRALRFLASLLLLVMTVPPVSALPAQVILLRHAEKPLDESNPHLSPRGEQRARALVTLLTTNPVLTAHGPPAALFATRATRKRPSNRPVETLQPLAGVLKLPIQTPYTADNTAALAKAILRNPAYDGKTVVVCWVSDDLPELAEALGIKPKPSPWKKKVYDRAWRVLFQEGKVSLNNFPQALLPGDAIY